MLEASVQCWNSASGPTSVVRLRVLPPCLPGQAQSVEQARARQQALAKMRSLLFHQEAKLKHLAKIKSKDYHRRAQRAARAKVGSCSTQCGQTEPLLMQCQALISSKCGRNGMEQSMRCEAKPHCTWPLKCCSQVHRGCCVGGLQAQKAGEMGDTEFLRLAAEEAEFKRAKERLTLKHRNTSQWARRALKRGINVTDEGAAEGARHLPCRGFGQQAQLQGASDVIRMKRALASHGCQHWVRLKHSQKVLLRLLR